MRQAVRWQLNHERRATFFDRGLANAVTKRASIIPKDKVQGTPAPVNLDYHQKFYRAGLVR